MFNPSRATRDADNGDGALPICIRRAKRLAADREMSVGAVRVVNLFARRATDVVAEGWPRGSGLDSELWIGPDNDRHIREQSERAGLTVAAWGPSLVRTRSVSWRAAQVKAMLVDPWCLSVSPVSGQPYYAGPRGARRDAAIEPYV
jgi:hypothetical protein